uniref:Uncharacterized protein n=1 Tax=Meloidogyne enterolobii TaxID=390850 RepID=A0A6V7UYS8_MELEN|nr:unnamed protein product [Meloidogyne enterolobii]
MFGGGGDPFGNPFDHIHRQMRQMDNMMNSMLGDAFNMLNGFGNGMPHHPMLTDDEDFTSPHRNFNNQMMNPFGGFGFGGSMLGGMMSQMQNMHNAALNDPNSFVMSQSTMVSFDGNGPPKYVQSSTRKAGNVSETRRALRDGEREEVSIGHNIGDKSHIVEKKRDKDGKFRSQQKFVNMEEAEARDFNERFKTQARENLNGIAGLFGGHNTHRNQAIENGKRGRDSRKYLHNTGETSAPIITIPDDEEEQQRGRHYRNGRGGRHEDVIYSNNGIGPTIQEIDDNEGESSNANPKRRKGVFGKFLG